MRCAGLHPAPGAGMLPHHKHKGALPSLSDAKSRHRHKRHLFGPCIIIQSCFRLVLPMCVRKLAENRNRKHAGRVFPFTWIQILLYFRKTPNMMNLMMFVHYSLTRICRPADVLISSSSQPVPLRPDGKFTLPNLVLSLHVNEEI